MDANTLTAIGIVVAAVPTWIVAYKGLRQGQANGTKADVVIDGNEKIHTLVNSNTDRLKAEIKRLEDVIALLQHEGPRR